MSDKTTPETPLAIQVARVDQCSAPSHLVGFSVTHTETKRSIYLDAFVPKDEAGESPDQDALVKMAYARLEKTIQQFQAECEQQQQSIIGKKYDPSSERLVE